MVADAGAACIRSVSDLEKACKSFGNTASCCSEAYASR